MVLVFKIKKLCARVVHRYTMFNSSMYNILHLGAASASEGVLTSAYLNGADFFVVSIFNEAGAVA